MQACLKEAILPSYKLNNPPKRLSLHKNNLIKLNNARISSEGTCEKQRIPINRGKRRCGCTGVMIPLRRGVRGPNRSPFASLPLSYFLQQTYCKSSFEDCNSLPKILQRLPRKSYWARLNLYSIACFDEFSADISSKELSSSRITVDGFLRRRSYKKSLLSQNLILEKPA